MIKNTVLKIISCTPAAEVGGGIKVSLRTNFSQLEEMMQERGVFVDHSSINRWAIRFLPFLEKAFRKHNESTVARQVFLHKPLI